ncbi:hypothetical protein HOD38_03305 [archaeon]|jgi:hypothetical protein|nr:hypothetical protein [archaeon]MBT4397267.1 hypothetical protein [archaeon]MBT4440647.1 hypothetical protein [archaeon]
MHKLVLRRLFSKLIGIILFILFVIIANYLITYINEPLFTIIVETLNDSLLILVLLSFLYLGKEIFEILEFPYNIPYPIFSAAASVLLMYFLFSLLESINMNPEITEVILLVKYLAYLLVIVIVLAVGYTDILSRRRPLPKLKREEPKKVVKKAKKKKVAKKKTKKKTKKKKK